MSDVRWTIEGREFLNCNCAWGCPCQFNALPTYGHCRAFSAIEIERGHHGETRLDGLRFGVLLAWPGPIHEGRGEALPIVDERATSEQREALLRIMSGLDTEPGATIFQVFSTTYDKVHDPVFAPLDFEIDVDRRLARVDIPGVAQARGEPLRNPVTGEEHRARINLPDGFEYDVAEVGRGWTESQGPIALSFADTHTQFCRIHMTERGVVH